MSSKLKSPAVTIKTEPQDETIKTEPEDEICVFDVTPDGMARIKSERVLLYAGHDVKEEMVIGPTEIQRPLPGKIKMRDLSNLPENYDYKSIVNDDDHCILTKFRKKEDVEKWMADLQTLTKETWTIAKTFKVPPNPRNLFKRIYRCHFNTSTKNQGTDASDNVTKDKKRQKKSKNIDCKAKVTIAIKRIFEVSKSKKITYFSEEWPCVIKFQDSHNHRTDVVEALRERPVGEEAKRHLIELFSRGHSAASAYYTFCAEKMEEYGDDYENMLYDRFYMPTKNDVSNLWKKNFKEDCDRTGSNMLEKLEETLTKHKESNNVLYKTSRHHDDYAVAICTPLMQRALNLQQANEIMFVDASGNCDVYDHKVYFFLTQTAAGGLPIGCILSSCQKSDLFDVAVADLIEIMPKKVQPTVILTDNDLGERNVLQKHWPNATLLLCTFHVLKAIWRWILTSKNGVPRDDAQNYYKLFKTILYATTPEKLEAAKEKFFEDCKHEGLKEYIRKVYINNEQAWCIFYRRNLPVRGSDTNNYTEVMFRLLKDIHLERAKAFNLVQLADYIVVCFENYYKQRILDLLYQRTSKTVAMKYLPISSEKTTVTCINMETLEFSVTSQHSENTFYLVDMQACKCTCPIGFNGKHCKHQGKVLRHYNFLTALNTWSNAMKRALFEVASGKIVDEGIFKSLIDTDEQEKEIVQKHAENEIQMSAEIDIGSIDTIKPLNNGPIIIHDANNIKQRYLHHCAEILKKLEEDPENFAPAIDTFLENYNKYAGSKTTLLSGLCTAFKWKGVSAKHHAKNKCRQRVKSIPVQPTSVARRCATKKSVAVGRAPKGIRKARAKAPHCLKTCVAKNMALGINKSKK